MITEQQLKALGVEMKRLREVRGLTQDEVGAAVSISGAAICRYENGTRQPEAAVLFGLEKVLHAPEYSLVKFLKPA